MMTYEEWCEHCEQWMAAGCDGVRGGPLSFLREVEKKYGLNDDLYAPAWAEAYAKELLKVEREGDDGAGETV